MSEGDDDQFVLSPVVSKIAEAVLQQLKHDTEPTASPSPEDEFDITWHDTPDLALSLGDDKFVFNLNYDPTQSVSWKDKSDVQRCAKQVVDAIQPLLSESDQSSSQRQPQPPPINRGENVPANFRTWAAGKGFDAAVQLSHSRDEFGFQKYGQRLMTKDGRDSVEDAIDEVGDFFHYAWKARMNGEDISRLRELVRVMNAVLQDDTA